MSEAAIRAAGAPNLSGPTAEDILRWPATVDPATAGTAFGISRSYAYELVKRGDFPAKVIRVGGKARVVTADVQRALGIAPNTSGAGPATGPATVSHDSPHSNSEGRHADRTTSPLRAVGR